MAMNFPTKEEFLHVFNLFPKGNPETIYREVKYAIMTYKTFTDQPVTWELISKSYSTYVEKRRNDEVEDKYIKTLDSFLKAKDYNIDFKNEPSMKSKNFMDKGLDDSMSDLERRLNSYKNDPGT